MNKSRHYGINFYHFDTLHDYIGNYRPIENKIWNYHNHHYRLNHVLIRDISRENLGSLEKISFNLKTLDNVELAGFAQINVKPIETLILLPLAGIIPIPYSYMTYPQEDVLSAKVNDLICIGGYFNELRRKNIPIRYLKIEGEVLNSLRNLLFQ